MLITQRIRPRPRVAILQTLSFSTTSSSTSSDNDNDNDNDSNGNGNGDSISDNTDDSNTKDKEPSKLRIAIIGGGVSGLSTALHLAPLVERGVIARPIHLYEKTCLTDNKGNVAHHPHESKCKNGEKYDEHFHPGSGTIGRDIGVGIWSTALEPFLGLNQNHPHETSFTNLNKNTNTNTNNKEQHGNSSEQKQVLTSHQNLITRLEELGQYIGKVGYRTPGGKWLTQSTLNTTSVSDHANAKGDANDTTSKERDPSLLFLREKDFLSSLRDAVSVEENDYGTIQTHYPNSKGDKSTQVERISLPRRNDIFQDGHSGKLVFASNDDDDDDDDSNNLEDGGRGNISEESFHVIIAADGMNSTLKSQYAGEEESVKLWKKLQSQQFLAGTQIRGDDQNNSSQSMFENTVDMNIIEDRNYVVFRGNAPLSDADAKMDNISFQTWGTERQMRFAAVGMSHPDENDIQQRREEQVWFATISDASLSSLNHPTERKEKLLECFNDWHDPIGRLIESTPADSILMERGVGHKHSLYPVMNLAEVMNYQSTTRKIKSDTHGGDGDSDVLPYTAGPGPILLFSGDAAMTVDPVLAQGFTIAMEAAADLSKTLESCLPDANSGSTKSSSSSSSSSHHHHHHDSLAFDSVGLRNALIDRNQRRYGRMLCLLRATELVGSMAQPKTDSIAGFISKNVIRPLMMVTPSLIKEAAFSYAMKYSLGYYGSYAMTQSKATIDDTLARERKSLRKEKR